MKNLKVILGLLGAALIVVIFAACGSSNNSTKTVAQPPALSLDFVVKTISDEVVSFSDLKGKPLVINFGASWCIPCEEEAPILVAVHQKYKDRVQFFGMAVRDTKEDQLAFAQRHGFEFPVGLDSDGKILYQYQRAARVSISGIPTTFFIDKDGKIVDYWIGPMSEAQFDQKMQKILPQ